MSDELDLRPYGLSVREILRNAPAARLYEHGVKYDGEWITSTGALATSSGERSGRSPRDKRIVKHPSSARDIWWGSVNIELADESFLRLREQAREFLNSRKRLYVVDVNKTDTGPAVVLNWRDRAKATTLLADALREMVTASPPNAPRKRG